MTANCRKKRSPTLASQTRVAVLSPQSRGTGLGADDAATGEQCGHHLPSADSSARPQEGQYVVKEDIAKVNQFSVFSFQWPVGESLAEN